MLALRSRKSMMFHVKHSLPTSGKKLPAKRHFLSVSDIWTRMESALRSIKPRATKKELAELIKSGGTSITVRTLSTYAAGTSLPGLDVVAAVSVATKVPLDELVFGVQQKIPSSHIAQMFKHAEELLSEGKRRTGHGQGDFTTERAELLDAIAAMQEDQIQLMLKLTKELKAR